MTFAKFSSTVIIRVNKRNKKQNGNKVPVMNSCIARQYVDLPEPGGPMTICPKIPISVTKYRHHKNDDIEK